MKKKSDKMSLKKVSVVDFFLYIINDNNDANPAVAS